MVFHYSSTKTTQHRYSKHILSEPKEEENRQTPNEGILHDWPYTAEGQSPNTKLRLGKFSRIDDNKAKIAKNVNLD